MLEEKDNVRSDSVSQDKSRLQLYKHLDSLHQRCYRAELVGSAKFIWMALISGSRFSFQKEEVRGSLSGLPRKSCRSASSPVGNSRNGVGETGPFTQKPQWETRW